MITADILGISKFLKCKSNENWQRNHSGYIYAPSLFEW